ncbi:MAG: hypothetical protein WKF57_02580 [Nakamurella sp.]
MIDPEVGDPTGRVSCALCGTHADPMPMTWLTEFDAGTGTRHYCDRCSRDNLRSVEAKLSPEWW